MTCQDSFHEVAFNISFWTRNISSARILFWRGVNSNRKGVIVIRGHRHAEIVNEFLKFINPLSFHGIWSSISKISRNTDSFQF